MSSVVGGETNNMRGDEEIMVEDFSRPGAGPNH